MKKKVFVTGADGMLGNALVRELLQTGFQVKALLQRERNSAFLKELPIEIIFGELLDPATYRQHLSDCHYLINCAAITKIYPRKCTDCMRVNYDAVKMLAQEVLKAKVEHFIHVGSANSFGGGTKENPGTEKNKFNLNKYRMSYITSKYLAQKHLLEMHEKHQLKVTLINPTFMIGPFDSMPSSGKMLKAFFTQKMPGYTKGGRSFVYSVDVARLIVNALGKARCGEVYIAGGHNLFYEEFLKIAAAQYNKEFALKKLPIAFVYCYGFFSSVFARVLNKIPVLSFGTSLMAGKSQFYSSEKARQELGYQTQPIELAIKESVDWMLNHQVFKMK